MRMHGKPRVVFDSNIYISAFLFGGKPLAALRLAEQGAVVLLTSAALRNEVEEVLKEKSQFTRALIDTACAPIWHLAEDVVSAIQVDICADEDDNRVLECAIAGQASYVVTGDRHLLELPPVSQYTILRVSGFLEVAAAYL